MPSEVPILLLVEDDPNDEELARIALDATGLALGLVVVRDGAEALEWLLRTGKHAGRSPDPSPRLVLLDLKLPRLNGLEVLAALRSDERTRYLPVAVFTSSSEEKDLVRSYELGANAYLRKPIDFEDYTSLVGVTAAFWMERNEVPGRDVLGGVR